MQSVALPERTARIPDVTPGATFGERYRIVGALGSGGMAEVYEVEHQLTRRHLALKLLKPEALAHPASVERFFREASVCAGIDSDHIVQMIDCGVDGPSHTPFLVMELLHGRDLARTLRESSAEGTTIPYALVLAILKQTASALDKVHGQGIVHRDLKPANLFLTFPSDGPPRVKILDFGIAKLTTGDTLGDPGAASGSSGLGTPLYMAPEQLTADGPVGPATDVWALGLIAYELQVGAPYWQGHTAASLATALPDRNARPLPSALAVTHGVILPSSFDRWLLRCLDPEPRRRPQSAGAAVGALLRLHDPRATLAPVPGSTASVPLPVPVAVPPRVSAPPPEASTVPLPHRMPEATPAPAVIPAAPPEVSSPEPPPRRALPPMPTAPAPGTVPEPTRAPASEAPTIVRIPPPPRAPAVTPATPAPAPAPAPVTAPAPVPAPATVSVAPRRPAQSPPEVTVFPWGTMALAAVSTGALVGATAWAVLHDRRPTVAPAPISLTWPAPSMSDSAVLTAACSTWTHALLARQQSDGSFASGVSGAPSSGGDTGRQLTALLSARRAGVPLAQDTVSRALAALDDFRLPGGWADAPADRHTVRPATPATAWATLAYAALADASPSAEGRARADAARDQLLAGQVSDGGFRYLLTPDAAPAAGTYATVMALWALVETERLDPTPSPAAVAARRGAQSWLRRAWHAPTPSMDPGGARLASLPGLAEQSAWVLLRARTITHEGTPEDTAMALSMARSLAARCAGAEGGTCVTGRGNDGLVRQQATATTDVDVAIPWLPWALAVGSALLRDDTVALPPDVRTGLSALVRGALSGIARDQVVISADPADRVAEHLLTASDVLR